MAEANNENIIVYFLIPVFNEEENIESLAGDLIKCLPGIPRKYVFVDDGSTDDSVSFIQRSFGSADYIILGDRKNHGPGHAFNTGFEWILKNCSTRNGLIVTIEADNTSDPGILPVMFMLSQSGYNLVLASIYIQSGGLVGTTLLRKVLSVIANIMLRFTFNIKVQTLSSFYRIYSIQLIRNIKETYTNIINESGFLCMIEVLLKAIRVNALVIEVPMILKSSKRIGKSKMKISRTILSYILFLLKNIK